MPGNNRTRYFYYRPTLAVCSHDFSTNCLMVKIMSVHPLPFLNPHCDSGSSSSVIFCSHSWSTLATTFPTTTNNGIPLQLSHELRSPFLGIGTSIASHQSAGTLHSLHTSLTNSSSHFMHSSVQQAAFNISGRMPVSPLTFPHFNFPNVFCNSSADGGSPISGLIGLCLTLSNSSTENSL